MGIRNIFTLSMAVSIDLERIGQEDSNSNIGIYESTFRCSRCLALNLNFCFDIFKTFP